MRGSKDTTGRTFRGRRPGPVSSRPAKFGRILLVLSLWHAPIPWLHHHDLEGPAVAHTPALYSHVHEFHPAAAEQGLSHSDWHAHLLLPWCHEALPCSEEDNLPLPHDALPEDCIACRADSAPAQSAAALELSPKLADDICAAICSSQRAGLRATDRGIPTAAWGGHFLSAGECAKSLVDLLSVRRC